MLEVRELTKRYGTVTALDGASLTAGPGRLVGFLGPNGAGKTTTMRCVFGLATPDAGEVTLGWARRSTATTRLRFGYMPEQRGLYPRMRVVDQLVYFGRHHGLSGREARTSASAWLERFGLADRSGSRLEDLSHGNQQRVQLATALVHDPVLLVLDEPFSGLDPLGVATMTEVLRERAAAGVCVVFSSHQLDLVEEVCEDVAIISRGRIVAAGEIDELKAASGRRHLEVEVAGARAPWPDDGSGLTVLDRDGDAVRLLVDERADLGALLASARAAGEVRQFSYGPPRLSELFMEAVAVPQGGPGGGQVRRSTVIGLVAQREIIERGRSRGYLVSLLFTLFLLVVGFVLPSAHARQPGDAELALVEAVAGTAERRRSSGHRRGLRPRSSSSRPYPTEPPPRRRSAARSIDAALEVPADLSGPGDADRPRSGRTRSSRRSSAVPSSPCGPARRPARRTSTALQPPSESDTTAIIFANAGIILMFIGIFTYGTWVLTGVVEEKQSRVVEVVLSTVRPRDLLMGKVLGIGAAGARPARGAGRGRPRRRRS